MLRLLVVASHFHPANRTNCFRQKRAESMISSRTKCVVILWICISMVQVCFALFDITSPVIINEIDVDNTGAKEIAEFIELKATTVSGKKVPSLHPYMVIIIKAFDQEAKGPVITFSADLCHSSFPSKSRYFVIGTPSEKIKPDLAFSHDDVAYKYKGAKQDTKITQFFKASNVIPEGDGYPMAVILLKEEQQIGGRGISLLKLQTRDSKTHRPVSSVQHKLLTEDLQTVINDHIVDLVIYSRRAKFNRCPILYKLCTVLEAAEYALGPNYCYELLPGAEWDRRSRTEFSLNKCPNDMYEERSPFLFTKWKLGKPTPHKENDCTGIQFIIQKYLEDHQPRDVGSTEHEAESGCIGTNLWITDESARDKLDKAAAASTSDAALQEQLSCNIFEPPPEEQLYCGPEQADNACAMVKLDHDIVHLSSLLQQVIQQKEADGTKPPASKKAKAEGAEDIKKAQIWRDKNNFLPDWLAQIKQYHESLVPLITKSRKPWLQYFHNSDEPDQSFFRCRFCHDYLKKNPTQARYTPTLAEERGYVIGGNDAAAVSRKFCEHAAAKMHDRALKDLKSNYKNKLTDFFESTKQKDVAEPSSTDLATQRVIRTVYTEVYLNIAFDSHSDIVTLQKTNGLDLGIHHYERTSAVKMMESISSKMKQHFCEHIRTTEYPLTLIVDTTTDTHDRNFLIMYIRTLEYNYAHVYFYALKLVQSETAESLFTIIDQELENDRMKDIFKERLLGFASDGASVMTGAKGGLGTLLKKRYNKNMYAIHCMAHKLQLVMVHAYESLPYLQDEFEAMVNSIYNFFNKHAVKRKAALLITAETYESTLYELMYIHRIRWVSSELQALEKLHKSLPTVLETLKRIKDSSDFDKDTVATAKGFLKRFGDAKFYITLAHVRDVLAVIAEQSQALQNRGASLINQEQARRDLFGAITDLKEEEGPQLTLLLSNCKCFKSASWEECVIEDLDDKNIQCDGNTFEHTQRSAYLPLSQLREKLSTAIETQLNLYFPEGALEMFEVLSPARLPVKISDVSDFALRIKDLAERFKFDVVATSQEYESLLRSLIGDHFETYSTHKSTDSPVQFWGYFLNYEDIYWADNIRRLITIVLSLPVGTADAERGFSILKTALDHRVSLAVEHLEDILFVRINGPPIDKFDAASYARYWLDTGHMRSDDTAWERTKKDSKKDFGQSVLF